MPRGSSQAAPVGVDRLQPGDHAFLPFSDDEEHWNILAVFTQNGLARDEQVLLRVDARHADEAIDRVASREAVLSGQLIVSSKPLGPGPFDPLRAARSLRRRVDDAISQGYIGMRLAGEMSLSLVPGASWDQIVRYEVALNDLLFTQLAVPRVTALCQWDNRELGGTAVLDTMRDMHRVHVLGRVGALHAALTDSGLRLTGDADLSTRAELTAALHVLADQPGPALVLDITDLSFLDAHSAGAILRLARNLHASQHLHIRCRRHHRRMLYVLGGKAYPRLSVSVERL